MTILVVGANGQVGSHLRKLLPEARSWGRNECDLLQPDGVTTAILSLKPSLIVNCAAYTAVDKAESEPQLAWLTNAAAPAAMANAARALDIPMVHMSTDYVFDGTARFPYRERDGRNPINTYGRTKLAGDLAVETLCDQHWILRTSWVFSEHGSNFVKTVLRLLNERSSLAVVSDQRGRPTYAGDLATLIVALIKRLQEPGSNVAPGTYHVGGGPALSWYEFALEIAAQATEHGLLARTPDIKPIPTEQYPTPAKRPRFAVLQVNSAFQGSLPVAPDWRTGLTHALRGLTAPSASQTP